MFVFEKFFIARFSETAIVVGSPSGTIARIKAIIKVSKS